MLEPMRWRLAVGLGLGLGLAQACGEQGFACTDDEQCTLAGEPGRCVTGGRCAYPEPSCPSGLSYPQGAPAGLAGECVAPDDAASGTGDAGGTSTAATADEGTTATTVDGSSGPAGCEDEHEPNDDQLQASPIPFGGNGDCQASWDAALDDSLDADWFVLEAVNDACPVGVGITFLTEPALELCAVPQCPGELAPELTACDGEQVTLATGQACCGIGQVQVTASCFGVPPTVALGIAASADTAACLPYRVTASS